MKKLLLILLLTPICCLSKELKITKQIGLKENQIVYKDTCFSIEYFCDKIIINNKSYSITRKVSADFDSELVIDEYYNKNIKLVLKIDVVNSKILQVELWKKPFDYVQIFRL